MDLSGYLLAWRTTALPDREVIDALVHPAHAGPSSALAAALADWPGGHYWSDEPDGRHLVLTRPIGRRRRNAWAVHLLLLAATLFTTTFVGAVLLGAIPFDPNPLALLLGTYPFPRDFIHAWAKGLPFSAPLLAILLCHELGHYVTARRYQLDVSLPFFIPAPVVPWSIGTMGAFIRLRTVVSDRRQLLDVGAAGPIAGLLVALPVLARPCSATRCSRLRCVTWCAARHRPSSSTRSPSPAGSACSSRCSTCFPSRNSMAATFSTRRCRGGIAGPRSGSGRSSWRSAFTGEGGSCGEGSCCCCRAGASVTRRCWTCTGRCRGRAACSHGRRWFSSS